MLSLTCDCTMYASLRGRHQQWLGSAAYGAAVTCSNLVTSLYVDCKRGLGEQALRVGVPCVHWLVSCMQKSKNKITRHYYAPNFSLQVVPAVSALVCSFHCVEHMLTIAG